MLAQLSLCRHTPHHPLQQMICCSEENSTYRRRLCTSSRAFGTVRLARMAEEFGYGWTNRNLAALISHTQDHAHRRCGGSICHYRIHGTSHIHLGSWAFLFPFRFLKICLSTRRSNIILRGEVPIYCRNMIRIQGNKLQGRRLAGTNPIIRIYPARNWTRRSHPPSVYVLEVRFFSVSVPSGGIVIGMHDGQCMPAPTSTLG